MRACSVSEQASHIPLDGLTFLRWLSRWWRGQHESASPSFSIMPVIKHQPIAVEMPPIENAADSVEGVASIAAAVAAGELTATEAAELAEVVDAYGGALASREFEERLSKLEKGISDAPAVPTRGAARDDATV